MERKPGQIGAPRTAQGRQNRADILDLCQSYRAEHGYFPTRRAVCEALDISAGSFTHHVGSLVKQGYLKYEPGSFSRTLRLTRKQRKWLE